MIRELPNSSGAYLVSDDGRVFTRRTMKGSDRTRSVLAEPREMSGQVTADGYRRVELRRAGERCPTLVHRLVAEVFLGPCPPGLEVNHRDGNKLNNAVENLEYCSTQENVAHAVRHNLIPRGEKRGCAKLTSQVVNEIRRRYAAGGTSTRKLAKEYGVAYCTVSSVVTGRTWCHVRGEVFGDESSMPEVCK